MFVFQENSNSVLAIEEVKPIQDLLSLLILLADRVINAAQEAESSKAGNLAIASLATDISKVLQPLPRLTTTSTTIYDRPIRRICLDVTKALDRALTFARRCRYERTNFLHHVLSINTAADFKKASNLLESSLADLRWLLCIYNRDCCDHGTMPPFACTDPILAYVWPAIAALHMGPAEGAQQLAVFASDNERTKQIIVEEDGIPSLLKILSDCGNVEGQSAAATALFNLGDDPYRVRVIRNALGVQAIVKAMAKAPTGVRLILVDLVLKMLEEFGVENVTSVLVALLGVDVDLDEFLELNYPKTTSSSNLSGEISEEMNGGCSRGEDTPEVKLKLKVNCVVCLWKLARRSLLNCRNI